MISSISKRIRVGEASAAGAAHCTHYYLDPTAQSLAPQKPPTCREKTSREIRVAPGVGCA